MRHRASVVRTSVCLWARRFVCLSVCLSVYVGVDVCCVVSVRFVCHRSVCRFLCLFVRLSVCSSVCSSVGCSYLGAFGSVWGYEGVFGICPVLCRASACWAHLTGGFCLYRRIGVVERARVRHQRCVRAEWLVATLHVEARWAVLAARAGHPVGPCSIVDDARHAVKFSINQHLAYITGLITSIWPN